MKNNWKETWRHTYVEASETASHKMTKKIQTLRTSWECSSFSCAGQEKQDSNISATVHLICYLEELNLSRCWCQTRWKQGSSGRCPIHLRAHLHTCCCLPPPACREPHHCGQEPPWDDAAPHRPQQPGSAELLSCCGWSLSPHWSKGRWTPAGPGPAPGSSPQHSHPSQLPFCSCILL